MLKSMLLLNTINIIYAYKFYNIYNKIECYSLNKWSNEDACNKFKDFMLNINLRNVICQPVNKELMCFPTMLTYDDESINIRAASSNIFPKMMEKLDKF